jgi:cobalt-zinc-cadmium efflux system outer membrane protein
VKTGPLAMGAARRKLGRALAIGVAAAILAAADPSSPAAANAEPAPGATVEELLALVRTFNPDLAAAALDREQAVAKIYPAGALDDPTLTLGRDQGFRNTTFSVSQEFPLWGKRELRSGVATADAAAARGREGSVATELEEQVKVTFAQYYQSARAIGVTREIDALLRDLAGTVRARYGQGLGNQSDAIRADLEQTRLGPKLSALERDEQVAKAKINALIAHPADAKLAPPATLRKVPGLASLQLDVLMARARDGNPMLATARAEIVSAEGERTLVNKSWYPDVTVSVGGNDLPGQSPGRLVAGVGIKIPLQWGVRDAQAHAASAKQAAAQARRDGALLKIESDLQVALATLKQAQRTANLLKNALTQQSAAAYRSALVTYERGRGDLTPVLDAARQQLEIRLELLEVQMQEQTALAAIERLIGGDL